MLNTKNRGLQAPGQYALSLDGEDIGRGSFENLFKKMTFGNCASCPEGTELFSMVLRTCGRMTVRVLELLQAEGGAQGVLVHQDDTTSLATQFSQFESCSGQGQGGDLGCTDPVQLTYDTCLDPSKCYSTQVESPDKQIAFLEVELGGVKPDGINENAVCEGASVFIGNETACFTGDFRLR